MSMFNIGVAGMNSAKVAMNVTAQNIANIYTLGYSRQEATIGALAGFGGKDNGQGSYVSNVRRMTDSFLVTQQWNATSQYTKSSTFEQQIGLAEKTLSAEGNNIALGLDGFFGSLSAAMSVPEGSAQRNNVLSSAKGLAVRFNQLKENFAQQESKTKQQLESSTMQVNNNLAQIADLNAKITDQKAQGVNTSVLEDSRDQIVRELSELMEVRVTTQADGSYSVSLPQGAPLVMGTDFGAVSFKDDSLSVSFGKEKFEIERLTGGTMAGLLEYRINDLPDIREQLDAMAKKLADDFNEQQLKGIDIHGNPGKPLFVYDPQNPAGSLRIADGFTGDDFAFASAGGGSGDNSNLENMIGIKEEQYEAYTNLIGAIAIKSAQAKSSAAGSLTLAQDATEKLFNLTGVAEHEETANIMAYNQLFQANAKVISTADQLFQSVLGMF